MADREERTPGRPRRAATDEGIALAALALLREHGPGGVNVAAVASRSGIARTTIYRRYRDRQELLGAALERVTVRGAPPEDVPVDAKLRWVLDRTEEVLVEGIGMGGVASVLTGSDPDFAGALRRSLDAALQPIRDQVDADVARGLLSEGLDADTLLTLILGAYLAETLLRDSPPSTAWKERLVEHLHALVAAGEERSQS